MRFFVHLTAVPLVALSLLGACTDAPISNNIQTGISGTRLEALRVVQLVYRQQGDAMIKELPYSGGNIAPVVKRMRERWPQLKPYLESGVVGLGSHGLLAMRDPAARPDQALNNLLRNENNDRAVLYQDSQREVGHTDRGNNWSPTTELIFAETWAEHAPSGWWVQDIRGDWTRKSADAAPARPRS